MNNENTEFVSIVRTDTGTGTGTVEELRERLRARVLEEAVPVYHFGEPKISCPTAIYHACQ